MNKTRALLSLFILTIIIEKGLSVMGVSVSANRENKLKELDCILIPERGVYTPFIVLRKTDTDYLIIRKHTIGPCAFSYVDSMSSYYPDSAIDNYLNTEYANRFSNEMQLYFINSEVEITAAESIGRCGQTTEIITRVFYVPSWTETTGKHDKTSLKEGTMFSRKFTDQYLSTTNDNGEPSAWWLRTPDTWYYNQILGINEDGSVSVGTTVDDTGVYLADVRPVCRVSAKIPIVNRDGQWIVLFNTE